MLRVKKIYSAALVSAILLTPLVVFASSHTAIDRIISAVSGTLNMVMGVLFILATLVFLWGVVMFIMKSGNQTERDKAKGIMLWGIIGLAVMAAAWGVARILIDYLGIGNAPPGIRQVPGQQRRPGNDFIDILRRFPFPY